MQNKFQETKKFLPPFGVEKLIIIFCPLKEKFSSIFEICLFFKNYLNFNSLKTVLIIAGQLNELLKYTLINIKLDE